MAVPDRVGLGFLGMCGQVATVGSCGQPLGLMDSMVEVHYRCRVLFYRLIYM